MKKVERPDFTEYLRPVEKMKLDEGLIRTIPFEDGEWNNDKFVQISGSTVSFKLQEGPYNTHGYNGCYPIQIVKFATELYRGFVVSHPSRETSMILTDLENALLHDILRSVKRYEDGLLGTGK